MKSTIAAACLLAGALSLPLSVAAADTRQATAEVFAQDTAITATIKARLAEERLSSFINIDVDTDHGGIVTLAGTAPTQFDSDKATAVARAVKGVVSVLNHIKVTSPR